MSPYPLLISSLAWPPQELPPRPNESVIAARDQRSGAWMVCDQVICLLIWRFTPQPARLPRPPKPLPLSLPIHPLPNDGYEDKSDDNDGDYDDLHCFDHSFTLTHPFTLCLMMMVRKSDNDDDVTVIMVIMISYAPSLFPNTVHYSSSSHFHSLAASWRQ